MSTKCRKCHMAYNEAANADRACMIHPGAQVREYGRFIYSCCKRQPGEPGCKANGRHEPEAQAKPPAYTAPPSAAPAQPPAYPTQTSQPTVYPTPPGQQPGYPYGAPAAAPPPQQPPQPQMSWMTPYGAPQPHEMPAIQQWFFYVDKDHSGFIDSGELNAAMEQGGIKLSPGTATSMIRMFDRERKGVISLSEFGCLHKYTTAMREAFQHFDRDRSGALDYNELFQALQMAHMHLNAQNYPELFRRFDKSRSGTLTLSEYMDLVVFLGICRSAFEWYDTDHDGRITLDFETFAIMASGLMA